MLASFFYVGSFFTHPMLASFFMWGVSLTHPVLASFLRGEFFLHIPCWLNFHLGSFSYTSHAGFIFMCGVSSRHPMLASFLCVEFLTLPELASLLCGEFLLHIPCWLFFFFFFFNLGSFSYTSRAGFIFSVGSFSYTSRAGFIFIRGVSLERPVLALFLSRESLLHIPCLLFISVGSLFYSSWDGSLSPPPTPSAGCIFYAGSFSYIPCWLLIYLYLGVSLTHPALALFFRWEFLLHISSCLMFLWGVFLTHPMMAFFFFFFPSFLIWGVSLTHPVLAFNSFIYIWEFLLHIPRWLYFSVGSFSYTSHACLMFLWGVSLTHPMMAFFLMGRVSLTYPKLLSFLCGEFPLHIPSCLMFYVGSFSYTSRADFFFCG